MAKQPAAKKTTRRAVIADAPAKKPRTSVIEGDPSANSPINKSLAAQTQGPADQQQALKIAKDEGDDIVTAVVPKNFNLTDNQHRLFEYEAGVIDMPRSHAEHWFAVAQGVSIHKGK